MKNLKSFLLVLVCLAVIAQLPSFVSAYNWGNPILNSAFDSNLTNWTGTNATWVSTENHSSTGTGSAKITANGGSIIQTVTVPSGNQNYYEEVNIACKNNNGAAATITVTFVDNGETHIKTFPLSANSGWVGFYFFHTIRNGTNFTLQVQSSIGSAGTDAVYIDDVAMNSHPANGSFEDDLDNINSGGINKSYTPKDFFPDGWDRAWQQWHATYNYGEHVYFQAISIPLSESGRPSGSDVQGTRCGLLSFDGMRMGNQAYSPANEWVSFYSTVEDITQSFASFGASKTATLEATVWSQYSDCSAILRIGTSWSTFSDSTIEVPLNTVGDGLAVRSSPFTITPANTTPGTFVQIICITPKKPMYVDAVKLKVQ